MRKPRTVDLTKARTTRPVMKKLDDETRSLIAAWVKFKENLAQIFDNAKAVTVSLQFESSTDEKHHYSFNSDEVIYLKDVKVNPVDSKVMFEVPHGAKDKYFKRDDAEIIDVEDMDGGTSSLTDCINEAYKAAFAENFPVLRTINHLEAKIKGNVDLVAILNDPDKWLKEAGKFEERGTLYTKLTNFGIF